MADWRERRLGDIGKVVGGGTPSRERAEYWEGTIRWLTPGELTGTSQKYVSETQDCITELGLATSGARLLPQGSLLVTSRASIGSCALAGVPMATNQGFKNLVPSAEVDPSFLFYLGRMLGREMTRRASGTTFLEISGREFGRITVGLPPLEEQRRIAEILDTIDETIQATDRVIAKLRLVQLGLIDRSFDRSRGTFTELGAVCLAPGEYGCVATAEQRRTGWPRYVRITDLTEDGTLRPDSEMGVSPSVAQKAILHPGDIVFARSGATVGKTYLYDPVDGLCAFAGYLIRFRPDPTKALPEFIRWWAHSSLYWRWVKRTMREGAQPNINAREYAKAVLPLPSIEEQNSIVASIIAVDTEIKAERRCRQKLRQLRSGLAADLLSGRVRTVAA